MHATMRQSVLIVVTFILISPTLNQQVLTNIPFECRGRLDGFWRDLRYCDVFHACVGGEQKRSYGCPQVGERFYFDDNTQKCEFASRNTGGCQMNQYYTAVTNITASSGSQLSTQAPTEPWKIFAQSREQFSCASRQDGFYASRWCNVFYRCFGGVSSAFLCPLQRGTTRLWWIQHGSSQGLPEGPSATCTYPCDTGRQCASAGGIIVENGNQISESQQEAEVAYRQSPCSNQTDLGIGQPGGANQGGSSNTGGANQGGLPNTGGANQGGLPNTGGANQGGSSNTGGANQGGFPNTGGANQGGFPNTGGANQGGSSNTGGSFTVESDVSCNGQANGVYLPSRYCNIFHRCVSGIRFDFQCARARNSSYDLWWNQQTNLCDWPCRVQCNNQLYGSSSSAQQVSSESLVFF